MVILGEQESVQDLIWDQSLAMGTESGWTRDNKEEEWAGSNACRVQSKSLWAPEAFLTQSTLSPNSLSQHFVESPPQPYRALETTDKSLST